ncbi:alginate lyase family protein [Desertivirga arenae]|uniref:alginate lyase family protein n=1 Tax=Desertivirga arenae TaxID=2810309 RepID=UPI001A968054|nr:alginate lyase family protein [Pedobacter sp. SYSU D00823]
MNEYLKSVILTTIIFFAAIFVVAYPHPGGMHTVEQIEFVKQQLLKKNPAYLMAYNQLIQKADSVITTRHHANPDLSIPGFYFKPEEHRKNSLGLQNDCFSAYTCALAWQLSGKAIYAERSLYFINAWSSINKTYSEADGPLVLCYSGGALVMAAELMRSFRGWKNEDREHFSWWIKYVYRKAGNEIRGRTNNWGDWGRFASSLADYYLDDEEDMAENIRLFKTDLFEKIAEDGHMIEEVKRGANGIWYTYFSLAPITATSWIILNASGENLFRYERNNKSMKKALDYLLYFQQRPSEWTWFKDPRTGLKGDKYGCWPANLIEAMSGIFKDPAFDKFLTPLRPLVYAQHDFAWVYPTLMPLSLNYHTEKK